MSRPVEYTDEVIKWICGSMEKYTQETPIPKFAEFCFINELSREYLYEIARSNKELSYNIKRLFLKKETALENGILSQTVNVTGGIFSLKQLGWSDKQININENLNTTTSPEKAEEILQKYFEGQ